MPLPHPSRRTGRRLLATGALAAVAVLGTPAIASAAPVPDIPVLGDLIPGGGTGGAQPTPVIPAFPGGTPTLPGAGSGSPTDSIEAGAACFQGLISGIQVSVTGIATGLTEAFIGLLGGGSTPVPVTPTGTASQMISLDPADLADLLDLSPEQLTELLAGGQEDLTMVVEVVIDGVTQLLDVVIDFAECLAALVPAPAATTTPPTTQPSTPDPVAPVVTPTTTPAPAVAAPVAYPGYAPTGGAPTEDSSTPLALAGLAALSAAAGGGALWVRRRGLTD